MKEQIMREIELNKLKEVLIDRMEHLDKNLHNQSKLIREMHSARLKEHGDIISMDSQLRLEGSVLARTQDEIKAIRASLAKFKNNTYGICEMCGDDINIMRLKAKPHAKYCTLCREIYEREHKRN